MATDIFASAVMQKTTSEKSAEQTPFFGDLEQRSSASFTCDDRDKYQNVGERNRKQLSARWCSTLSLSWSISGLLTVIVVWIGCMHWTQLTELRETVDRLDAELKQTELRFLHHISQFHTDVSLFCLEEI